MFSAVVVGKIYPGHLGSVIVIALMPLVLYAAETLVQSPNLKNSLFLGIVLCLQIVAGMLQLFYYSSIALALYLLIRLFQLYKTRKAGKAAAGTAQPPQPHLRHTKHVLLFALLSLLACLLLSAAYLLLPTISQIIQEGLVALILSLQATCHSTQSR
jgi:hypothetical protein